VERRDEGRGEGKLVVLVCVGMGRNLGRLIMDGRREGARERGSEGETAGMDGKEGWRIEVWTDGSMDKLLPLAALQSGQDPENFTLNVE
jgi:hypothetical protein